MRKNVLVWDSKDMATAPDGAKYALVSEHVRGEGTWWWAELWTDTRGVEISHPTDPWAKTKAQARAAAEHHAREHHANVE
uniref:hypothetical protein n=1 Tax=Streptomyces sp. AC495_CC817 TaxID=2823900 RepID=UPI001C257EFC